MISLGDLERAVMERLWASDEPLAVRDVHESLVAERPLAYTTVMTVLDRLAKKGLANRRRRGRAWTYTAARSREELTAQIMHDALGADRAGRTAALVAFVDRVTPDEARALRTALAAVEDARAT